LILPLQAQLPSERGTSVKNFLINLFRSKQVQTQADEKIEAKPDQPCCAGQVHIAYRGVSDDRLYFSHNRKWTDVKFFKPYGLKVFCAGCRRRLV
jgi:hypothetical protein